MVVILGGVSIVIHGNSLMNNLLDMVNKLGEKELISNKQRMAILYKESYLKLYKELPAWKKSVIDNCIKTKIYNDSLFTEFTRNVIIDAEKQVENKSDKFLIDKDLEKN